MKKSFLNGAIMSDNVFFVISVGKATVSMEIQSSCKHRQGKWSRKWLTLMTQFLSFERMGTQIWHVSTMCFSVLHVNFASAQNKIVRDGTIRKYWILEMHIFYWWLNAKLPLSQNITLIMPLKKMVFPLYQKHMHFNVFQISHSTLSSVSSVKTTVRHIFASAVTIAVIGC